MTERDYLLGEEFEKSIERAADIRLITTKEYEGLLRLGYGYNQNNRRRENDQTNHN